MRKIMIASVALLGLAAPAFASQDSGSLPPTNQSAGTFIVGSQDSGSLPDSVRGNA